MKKTHYKLLCLLVATVAAATAQQPGFADWQRSDAVMSEARRVLPKRYLVYAAGAGLQETISQRKSIVQEEIVLPTPGGGLQRFKLTEAPITAGGAAFSFPGISTYNLKGIDDPYANGKLDLNGSGLYAMVFSPAGDFFIDPVQTAGGDRYIVYYRKDFLKNGFFEPATEAAGVLKSSGRKTNAACFGNTIIHFRLAIACTHQYAISVTGKTAPTVEDVLARIVVTVNRVNGILEKDAGIRLLLVPSTTAAIFTTPEGDPFQKPTNVFGMIKQSQAVLDTFIGSANYDIGHTFSAAGGGLAVIGSLCHPNFKAQGVSGHSKPAGDPFDIDYVAHEIGHQLGANHSFNSTQGHCGGNRFANTAVEPGSGITVMGYAGLCGNDNIANNSIPYLHAASSDEIVHLTRMVHEQGCGTKEFTGNQPPQVDPLQRVHYIPRGTPFALQGMATDPDGDPVQYSWEEISSASSPGSWDADIRPYFRSYAPDTVPRRSFPSETIVRSGELTGTPGEFLSNRAQRLAFRLTVRDNRMSGGGLCSDSTVVQLTSAGPFTIMVPAATTTWQHGTEQLVCWDVNYTNASPVSCKKVNILYSTDDGVTYHQLLAATENDGYEKVQLPAFTESQPACRIKIEAADNIFFAVSRPFTITTGPVAAVTDAGGRQVNLAVWPNPADGEINVRLSEAADVELQLTDLTGRVLKEFRVQQGSAVVALPGIPAGLYLVKQPGSAGPAAIRLIKQ